MTHEQTAIQEDLEAKARILEENTLKELEQIERDREVKLKEMI